MNLKFSKLYSSKPDEQFNNLDINDCNPTDICTYKVLINSNKHCIRNNMRVLNQNIP